MSTWVGRVERMRDEKWRRGRGTMEARKTEIAMCDCIDSDLERVG